MALTCGNLRFAAVPRGTREPLTRIPKRKPAIATSAVRLALDEEQRRRIHAVAQAGRLGAIVEDVSQVRVTFCTQHLVAGHAKAAVRVLLYVLLRDRFPEARPAGAGIELGGGGEQGVLAAHATEDAFGMQVPVLAGERLLGTVLAGDVKLLGG